LADSTHSDRSAGAYRTALPIRTHRIGPRGSVKLQSVFSHNPNAAADSLGVSSSRKGLSVVGVVMFIASMLAYSILPAVGPSVFIDVPAVARLGGPLGR
jgi:hypothetical protein